MRSRHHPRIATCVLLLLASGLLLGTLPAARLRPSAQAMAGAPQFTLPPVITLRPTATRTPTPINIGNFVWDDLDRDGRQDASEPGLAGVTVQLWNSTKTQLIDTDLTDGSGLYTVVAPTPGSYRLRVLLPSVADQFSPKDLAGGDDGLDSDINPSGAHAGFSDVITLASNVISTTLFDAGIIVYRPPTPTRTPTPISIGNFVWHDLNVNGVQDGGEPGVNSIVVQLWNSTKTVLVDSDETNANGEYTLIAPTAGSYRVRVLVGSGIGFTWKNMGVSDGQDSDINPTGTDAGFTDIYDFAANTISIVSIDAGLVNVPTNWPSATPIPPPALKVFIPLVRR